MQSAYRSSQLQNWRMQSVQQRQGLFDYIPIGRLQRGDQHERGAMLSAFGTHAPNPGTPPILRYLLNFIYYSCILYYRRLTN